ncbi:MAG TPA: transposase [Thermoleophilaceae bacterium]|nr:transposase [Thermoleophilaceae bacterium]
MSPEAILGAGYAVALMVAALVLEWLSAHTHRRSLRYRTAGFEYHEDQDVWVCPEGEHLWPHEHDHEHRLVRYRARARVCNRCPVKQHCTDSDRGREVVRPLDPWPHSEAGRFHRVIALMLVALAGLVLVVAMARNHTPIEVAVLGSLLGVFVLVWRLLLRDLRTHPANFPEPDPTRG